MPKKNELLKKLIKKNKQRRRHAESWERAFYITIYLNQLKKMLKYRDLKPLRNDAALPPYRFS